MEDCPIEDCPLAYFAPGSELLFLEKILDALLISLCQKILMAKREEKAAATNIWIIKLPDAISIYAWASLVVIAIIMTKTKKALTSTDVTFFSIDTSCYTNRTMPIAGFDVIITGYCRFLFNVNLLSLPCWV